MTLEEMIEVLQAAKERKPIEMRAKVSGSKWTNRPYLLVNQSHGSDTWDFDHVIYRVKPEPIERWLVTDDAGDHYFTESCFAEGYIQARPNQKFKLVHLVEATKGEP